MDQTQRLLTTVQVADLLGLNLRKVQRMAESGELPVAQKMPGPFGRYVFDAPVIEAIARQRAKAAS
ncbi:MAG: helix-turn-helix domain-containing protein [Nitriliruptorales bacterium]|nr:helix-turn-helix domain-containing protein [Nitriliruptorales bacterium]